ncbi:host attachment protein [Noviherbaspirillum cavernae]|nr:host attachment protein [Noviherbaspirillum cavernae]
MKTTWIVAADKSRARIFEVQGVQQNFREIEDFINPAGDMEQKDLLSDERGHFNGNGRAQQGSDAQPKVDAVQHETELFSRQLSDYLDKARMEHRYDKLCLIAFPKFLGLMRQNLSKEAQKLVQDEMSKDISWFNARDVEDYIKTRLH